MRSVPNIDAIQSRKIKFNASTKSIRFSLAQFERVLRIYINITAVMNSLRDFNLKWGLKRGCFFEIIWHQPILFWEESKLKKQQGHQNRIGKKEERIVLHYDKETTTTMAAATATMMMMMIRYPFGWNQRRSHCKYQKRGNSLMFILGVQGSLSWSCCCTHTGNMWPAVAAVDDTEWHQV